MPIYYLVNSRISKLKGLLKTSLEGSFAGNMTFENFSLLLGGIAWDMHDFHAVAQWRIDIAHVIGSADEEHFAKIDTNIQELIFEVCVLNRV